jgi:hypothetical protein
VSLAHFGGFDPRNEDRDAFTHSFRNQQSTINNQQSTLDNQQSTIEVFVNWLNGAAVAAYHRGSRRRESACHGIA